MSQHFDSVLPIIEYLEYATYKKDRFFMIKKRCQNLNTEFTDIDPFNFISYCVRGDLQT